MNRRTRTVSIALLLLLPLAGCGGSPSVLEIDTDGDEVPDLFDMCPQTPVDETTDVAGCARSQLSVTVLLVNETGSAVEVSIILDSQQNLPEFLLTETGEQVDRTVPAGETLSFSRDCDDLQAILIEDADLLLLGGLGPESNTDVLRDGDDFRCGDTIVFTFTQPSTLDLSIAIDIQ